jgi:hypothetical protein
MAERLEMIEAYLDRHDGEALSHITYEESLAFYNGVAKEQVPSTVVLEVQRTIFSCVMCSAIFAESLPGTSPVGHRAVSV